MRAIPSRSGYRISRLRAMFARMKHLKEFGHAAAYTVGKKAARGMDKGLNTAASHVVHGINKGFEGIGKGITKFNSGLWNEINRRYPNLSQTEKLHRYQDAQLVAGVGVGATAIAGYTAGASAISKRLAYRKAEKGYTKDERKQRHAQFNWYRTSKSNLKRGDQVIKVDPRIRLAALKRSRMKRGR